MIGPHHDLNAKGLTGLIDTAAPTSGCFVNLRANDGGVVWHKSPPVAVWLAAAPDGGLLIAGTFTGMLDLGGATEPLMATNREGFVARLDPLTGEGKWVQKLDPSGVDSDFIYGFAAGPANEVAVAWSTDGISDDRVTLVDATGNVRWTQPARLQSIQTDGERIIGLDAYGFAQYSASGLDWRIDARCDLDGDTVTPGRELLALVDTYVLASVSCDTISPETQATVTIGDVSYTGDGEAILKLAR